MVAALTRIFGVHNLALAEDVVQDAFCRALEVWRIRGIPENPSAWLMATAKNDALDVLRRERTARTFAPEPGRFIRSEWTLAPVVEELFAADAIKDDLLRIMLFDITADFSARLPVVHRAIYLLFNEGYHGAFTETAVRVELCREAIRLAALLLDHPLGRTPVTHALVALMCLGAVRLPARVDASGNLISLFDQDRSRWDQELIAEGLKLLGLSAAGSELTQYQFEAAIASIHACARRIWEAPLTRGAASL